MEQGLRTREKTCRTDLSRYLWPHASAMPILDDLIVVLLWMSITSHAILGALLTRTARRGHLILYPSPTLCSQGGYVRLLER